MRNQKETATENLDKAIEAIADATKLINAKVAWMRAQAEKTGKIHWGHAGSANKVLADLEELLRFIGPTDEPKHTCPDCDSHDCKEHVDYKECQDCGAMF